MRACGTVRACFLTWPFAEILVRLEKPLDGRSSLSIVAFKNFIRTRQKRKVSIHWRLRRASRRTKSPFQISVWASDTPKLGWHSLRGLSTPLWVEHFPYVSVTVVWFNYLTPTGSLGYTFVEDQQFLKTIRTWALGHDIESVLPEKFHGRLKASSRILHGMDWSKQSNAIEHSS